jgi:hypothetical protein
MMEDSSEEADPPTPARARPVRTALRAVTLGAHHFEGFSSQLASPRSQPTPASPFPSPINPPLH